MKVPNKIPTRLYGRAAVNSRGGGTIWGGAFSASRGFPVPFPSSVKKKPELEEKVHESAENMVSPVQEAVPGAGQPAVDPVSAFSPLISAPVSDAASVISPAVSEPASDAAPSHSAAGSIPAPFVDSANPPAAGSTDIHAEGSLPEVREAVAPPPLVPATPAPFQPDHVHGYRTEVNADGTRSIQINSSRITIPDLDILAAIPG